MLWIKALHIIAMVSWFAGLFYLPRFFVYHTRHTSGPVHDQFCEMERKLYRFIMNPAMIVTAIMGIWLVVRQWSYVSASGWFWVKMALVAGLLFFHFSCGRHVLRFAAGANNKPERYFRLYNEIPTLILIGTIILAVVRPF